MQEVRRSARGRIFPFGIEGNVLLLTGLHFSVVTVLLLTDTYLRHVCQGAIRLHSLQEVLYVLFLIAALGLHAYNYARLYGSDPGWITFDTKLDDPQAPCSYCRMAPSLRSRHDFNTGQCVHKFDHFCPLMGTAIGDCNHLRFWLFNLTQTFLLLWGIILTYSALRPCIFPDEQQQGSCWSAAPIQTIFQGSLLILLWLLLNINGGLLILHSYLAATNQTTYEVVKGEKVPYLKPFYSTYGGPKQTKLIGIGLLGFCWRVVRGRGPPKPFSAPGGRWNAAAGNLELFFFGKKPHGYRYTHPAPMQPP